MLALVTIALGLTVHWGGSALSPALRDILGDALWAVMMVWAVSVLAPTATRGVRGAFALAICWTVELSQLHRAPAIDALRATTAGNLVLGSDFDPRDLAAYAAGIIAALLLEMAARRRAPRADSANVKLRAEG